MARDAQASTAQPPERALRRGWTTGACATAATKAALTALLTGEFPDPVDIVLPKGERPQFALSLEARSSDSATAGIVKDAGDDPDVTHGATVIATVRLLPAGSGLVFRAGEGVGTVTRAGLPIPPGEPAINPVPRKMMRMVVEEICTAHDLAGDVEITLSVAGGAALAAKTWNPRLGIIGGLSILGTTGIVRPFSCSAWIHAIHSGVDVARAAGLQHVVGATGSTSEQTARLQFGLPEIAMLDMGDFAGGLLKYLRKHPIERLTIAGGFAKMVKLAQGALDLHSGRSSVDMAWLADLVHATSGDDSNRQHILRANSALEVLQTSAIDGKAIAAAVANRAQSRALDVLAGAPVAVDVMIVARSGEVLAHAR